MPCSFMANNKPTDGKRFLRSLAKVFDSLASFPDSKISTLIILKKFQEKQDLAERVMITRLHLYGKWIKVMRVNATLGWRRRIFFSFSFNNNSKLRFCVLIVRNATMQKCMRKFRTRTYS